jgi:hypothetical protein
MPGFLLHKGANINCTHGGKASPQATSPRVEIMGQPIVLHPYPYMISQCPFTTESGSKPCTTGQWTSKSERLTSDNMPLLLHDAQSTSIPNGTPLVILKTQTRITGM